MTRIQRYIVEVKKEDTKLRQEEEKAKDPFEGKEAKRVNIRRHLMHAEEEELISIETNPIRREWCEGEKEAAYTRKVQSFIGKLKWGKTENEEGDITWIELYALYAIHGGGEDEKQSYDEDPLKKRSRSIPRFRSSRMQ